MLIPEKFHKSIYEALLLQLHGHKPAASNIIDNVFKKYSFVRGANNNWLHASTLLPARPPLTEADVKDLPAVSFPAMQVDAKGQTRTVWKANNDQKRKFARNGPLEGYIPLRGQCSCPIFGVHNEYPNDLALVVRPLNSNGAPVGACYIQHSEWPMSEEDAWLVLETIFAGIRPKYFELLHCARGCGEAGCGKLPIILVEGPSGSAKTATTRIEARMSGNRWPNMGEQQDDNFAEAFGELSATSTLVVFDEVFKDKSEKHVAAVRKFLLNLNRDYSYRKLYVGTVNEPCRTALVMADVEYPEEIKKDEQFGRRVVVARQLERVPQDWEEELGSDADRWMDYGNPKLGITPEKAKAAADVIHSAIVDRHFPAGSQPSFINIAHSLGFATLEEEYQISDQGREHADAVRIFFADVCDAYIPNPIDDQKYGRGFVELKTGDEKAVLNQSAKQMVFTASGNTSLTVEALKRAFEPVEGTIRKLLELKAPAQFEAKYKDNKTLVRFIERTDHSLRGKTHPVNRELGTDKTWQIVKPLQAARTKTETEAPKPQ